MSLRPLLRCVAVAAGLALAVAAFAQCPPSVPVEGAPPPAPLPMFPSDNWWNTDVSQAPVDAHSPSYIAFINNRDAHAAPRFRR